MKIGVVIPDRGDRPKFLELCKTMLQNQTRRPDIVLLVNYKPKSTQPDLTERIQKGFEYLQSKGCDCVLIIENDDYYSKDYIKYMTDEWSAKGRPQLLGIGNTTYYHLISQGIKKLNHPHRASLFNTLISCSYEVEFPEPNEVFLDLYLWKNMEGMTVQPDKIKAIGIKHGVGKCGGQGHDVRIYRNVDRDYQFLKDNTKEMFNSYLSIKEEILKEQTNQNQQTN